jgi:hypothetical protein
MKSPRGDAERLAQVLLDRLDSARMVDAPDPVDDALDAIGILPRLHALTADGGLPSLVGGRDFRTEVARLLDEVRRPAALGAALLIGRVEDARSDELETALEQRSAVQFLADDFRGTVAEGLVDDELFADGVDTNLAERLRKDAPLDVAVPHHIPASHWWWALAVRGA